MLICGLGWTPFRREFIIFPRARQAGQNTSVRSSRSCSPRCIAINDEGKGIHHLHSQLSHFDTSILGGQSVTIFPDSILELG